MKQEMIDAKLVKFIIVGVCNTAVSAAIMFGLYNLLHLGYWGASAVSYLLASVMSFFLNKNFTFRNKDSVWKTALRFSVNVAVCYAVSYSIAKPLVIWALSRFQLSSSLVDQVAMLFGMCMFTALNYVGQRFFAFREQKD